MSAPGRRRGGLTRHAAAMAMGLLLQGASAQPAAAGDGFFFDRSGGGGFFAYEDRRGGSGPDGVGPRPGIGPETGRATGEAAGEAGTEELRRMFDSVMRSREHAGAEQQAQDILSDIRRRLNQ